MYASLCIDNELMTESSWERVRTPNPIGRMSDKKSSLGICFFGHYQNENKRAPLDCVVSSFRQLVELV
jgi:hypothetical protein